LSTIRRPAPENLLRDTSVILEDLIESCEQAGVLIPNIQHIAYLLEEIDQFLESDPKPRSISLLESPSFAKW